MTERFRWKGRKESSTGSSRGTFGRACKTTGLLWWGKLQRTSGASIRRNRTRAKVFATRASKFVAKWARPFNRYGDDDSEGSAAACSSKDQEKSRRHGATAAAGSSFLWETCLCAG